MLLLFMLNGDEYTVQKKLELVQMAALLYSLGLFCYTLRLTPIYSTDQIEEAKPSLGG